LRVFISKFLVASDATKRLKKAEQIGKRFIMTHLFEWETVVDLVEIIEVDGYYSRMEAIGSVEVKSLEHLKKIAETFKEPFIFKKGKKEYVFFHHNVCYHCKE